MLVEDLARMLEVELVLAVHAPGQGCGPVQVVAGDGVLGRAALEDRQLVQLFVDTLARLLGQHLAFQAGAEFVGVGALVVLGDAQLLLDDLQLFLEEEFALVFADLAVDLGGQLLLQARDFHLLAQQRQDLLHPLEDRHGVQHFLQFAAGRGGQGRGEVGEWRRVVGTEAVQVVLQFLAVQRVERQQLLDRVDQGHAVGLHFVTGIDRGLRIVHLHHERRTMALDPAPDTHPRQALGDELQLAALARAWCTRTSVPCSGRLLTSKWRGSSGGLSMKNRASEWWSVLATSSRVSAQGSSLTITGSTCAGKNGRLWIGIT